MCEPLGSSTARREELVARDLALSVLIATFKRAAVLRETLESMRVMHHPDCAWELLCVDNCGDEETKMVVSEFADVLPIRYFVEQRRGKNAALNTGVQHAKGAVLVFTDDDVTVDEDWLIELQSGFERWPDIDVFGGRIVARFPSGVPPFRIRSILMRAAFAEADWGVPEGPYSPLRVWGPNMAVRSRVFDAGFGFDESVGPSGEDYANGSETSFLLTLAREGYEPVYLPSALVYHRIREEQVSLKWLEGRAFRAGRGAARRQSAEGSKRWFGVPRHLYRAITEAWISWKWSSVWRMDESERVERLMRFHHCRGRIHEWRKNARSKDSEN